MPGPDAGPKVTAYRERAGGPARFLFPSFLIFSFFVLPYACLPDAVEPALSLRFLLLGVLIFILGAAGLIAFSGGERVLRIPRLFLLLAAVYLGAHLLSFLPAANRSETGFETAKTLLFLVYTGSAAILLRSPPRLLVAAKAITVSALLMALLGILEYWGIFRPTNTGMPPGATIFNRNLLSSFLFLALGFVLVTAASQRGGWRAAGIACLLAIAYLLLLTRTRAAWLACAVALVVLALTAFRFGIVLLVRKMRRQWRFVAVLVAIPLLAIVGESVSRSAPFARGQTVPERLRSITDRSYASNWERLQLWKKTRSMIHDHPLVGVGAGNWQIALPAYGVQDLIDSTAVMKYTEVRPCNDFLWVFAETGVAGFAAYAGLFLLCGWYLVGVGLRLGGENRVIALILFPVLCGFVVISLFDFPKERIEHLVLLGTLFAFATVLGSPGSGSGYRISRPAFRFLLAGVAAIGLGAAWIGVCRLNGDIHVKKMREATMARDWKTVQSECDRAWSPFYTLEPTSTPLHWYRGVADFRLGDIGAACSDYERARRCHPHHLHVLNDLGTCLSLRGNQPEAESCYVAALRVSSDFEPTRVNLAALYYNTGRLDQAFRMISLCKGPHSDPRYGRFEKIITETFKKGGRS